jgi:large subunit ribosomal protein L17
MRHHVDNRKLGRTTSHRLAMFSNMLCSLVQNDRIETTLPKAKEIRRFAERLVTLGKRKTLHARRRAFTLVRDRDVVKKVFDELASRFATRNGGYTRIMKLGYRHGDSAPMAVIEYLQPEGHAEKSEVHTEKKAKGKEKAKHEKKASGTKGEPKPKKEAKPMKKMDVRPKAGAKPMTRKRSSEK